MKLEMISTGEEVLSGQIIDTNASWFSDLMMNHGVELQRRTTVGDRMEDLISVFNERSLQADVILINGGLGPTSDDLSAEAAARVLNEPLVENIPWREHLEAWFTKRNRVMPVSNLKQCLLPQSAVLVDNPPGSAPGFRVRLNQCWLYFTPGVPFEFKQMVQEQFIPFLQQEFHLAEATQLHKLLTFGHGESIMADRLNGLEVPEGITLGYRPSIPHVEIKVFARGDRAIAQLPDFTQKVRAALGTAVVAENTPSLADAVHHMLRDAGFTLSIAESCTGGMLTSLLVDFPGSSDYLRQGLVTYSNQAKIHHADVSAATLESFGAVSMETAREMARGVRRQQDCDFALSTTGIAGPDGGSELKPVGTVAIALATRYQTWIQTVHLSNRSRSLIRQLSCALALDMLRRALLGEDVIVDYPFITRTEQQVVNESQ